MLKPAGPEFDANGKTNKRDEMVNGKMVKLVKWQNRQGVRKW